MTFRIQLSQSQHHNGATIIAGATTLADALAFVGEFYEGPLLLSWVERDGLYIAEIYDWIDCWFDDPPVRARVITPPGIRPTDCRIWYRGGLRRAEAFKDD